MAKSEAPTHLRDPFLCLFFLNPFADICRAIRELDAFRFAIGQKVPRVAVHEFSLFQISQQPLMIRFGVQNFLQLSQGCRLNSTAQSKDNESSIDRSLNLKHRFGFSP